jgi:hypothetical protein
MTYEMQMAVRDREDEGVLKDFDENLSDDSSGDSPETLARNPSHPCVSLTPRKSSDEEKSEPQC